MPSWSRLAALAAAGAAYSLYEPYRYRLERKVVPIARPFREMTVLHVSDTHLGPRDSGLIGFLEGLPGRLGTLPDVVVATGDLIEGDAGIEPIVTCLSRLEARWGRFYVLGSHDYYQAAVPGYTKYISGNREAKGARRTASERLERGLQDAGWRSLKNTTHMVTTDFGRVRVAGVDDPYLYRHRTEHIKSASQDILALGLAHAPDVVSEWLLNGFDLVVAGHTHGGQVRIPGLGSLVTNCTLPAGLAAGLHRVGNGWLHVSRGLGTGRFAPVRFACTPEATLLTLKGVGID